MGFEADAELTTQRVRKGYMLDGYGSDTLYT